VSCVYAQEICLLVSAWSGGLIHVPAADSELQAWWNSALQGVAKEQRRRLVSVHIYTTAACFSMIRDEMKLREEACGHIFFLFLTLFNLNF
jgi:hypothetical protein